MPRYQVLITDRPWSDNTIERSILDEIDAQIIEADETDEERLVELARDADAIGVCWAPVTEGVIRAASGCRVISRFGIGLDNISVATATELGIPVTNVPDYCVSEVADHALALALALVRNVCFFNGRIDAGEYDLAAGPPMRRFSELTFGLVGLGRIGQAVLRRAHAFGFHVVAHTHSGNDHQTACRMVTFSELLAEADVISIHAPLSNATRHLFDRAAFTQMKDSAVLINTSRGPIVDQDALLDAVVESKIAGAALDVFETEPPDLTHPLFQHERVVATPHAAFVSGESVIELRTRATQHIADVLSGRRPQNIANPQVLD